MHLRAAAQEVNQGPLDRDTGPSGPRRVADPHIPLFLPAHSLLTLSTAESGNRVLKKGTASPSTLVTSRMLALRRAGIPPLS